MITTGGAVSLLRPAHVRLVAAPAEDPA